MAGNLQVLHPHPQKVWHFSGPFPTLFSFHHPKNTLDRRCESDIKTVLKNCREGDNRSSFYRLRLVRGSRTCDTIQCGPLPHTFWSNGCQQDSSWRGHTHSVSAHLHSALARSCQSRPLRKQKRLNHSTIQKMTKKQCSTSWKYHAEVLFLSPLTQKVPNIHNLLASFGYPLKQQNRIVLL